MSSNNHHLQKQKLTHMQFLARENAIKHHSYDEEMLQYDYIKQGNLKGIEESSRMFTKGQTGTLSKDPLRSKKYLFVASTTLVTRFCIEGGMEPETAYNLSDLYIQQADDCASVDAVDTLQKNMVTDFTMRMRAIEKTPHYSKPIVQCLDYIYDHLHMTISLKILADTVKLSPAYLSALFKKETGYTLTQYILAKRIEAAKNMLQYSDYSYLEISHFLAFSSHSHFVKCFKQATGYTPKTYRQRFFRKSLESL